jgi:hypothetical protein
MLYNNIKCTVFNMWGFQMQKSLTWGGGVQYRGVHFPPFQSHAEKPLLRFPQAHAR